MDDWPCVVCLSFIAFNISYQLSSKLFPSPVKYRDQKRKEWLWKNISISRLHSLITATLSVYSLCRRPTMLENVIDSWNPLAHYTLALSAGYFLYDFINLASNDLDKSVCILIHHVIVFVAFCVSLISRKYVVFGLVALLMEVNSVFLHTRRLLRMSDIGPTIMAYKINTLLLVITFISFRLIVCAWMINFLVSHRHILPPTHFAIGTGGMCILTPQNIFLLKQIWTSDMRNHEQTSSQKEKMTKENQREFPVHRRSFGQFLSMSIAQANEQ